MFAALVLAVAALITFTSVNDPGGVPWANRMRRVARARDADHHEWMAPDDVLEQVKAHYLHAVEWMQDTALMAQRQQWLNAPTHLTGSFLRRYQHVLMQQRNLNAIAPVGVLRADHRLEVRHFSENGERCALIDYQTDRRMATYDQRTQRRILTQDLGAATVVYSMKYDPRDSRWKIESFVQELPTGWGKGSGRYFREQELSPARSTPGRDN